jgi:protein phosphatase
VLVDLANLRGGPDNITVVIVRVHEASEAVSAPRKKPAREEPPLVSPLLLGGTILCFLIATVLGGLALGGQPQTIGAMVVMLILGAIGAAFSAAQYTKNRKAMPARPTVTGGGGGPYRTYDAKPTSDLYDRLGSTVQALRDAAKERNWKMNWKKVESFQSKGRQALQAKDAKRAIRCQAEAIIETMNQLREQHNRGASDTAIDY